ncbi:MAG TPA: AAA family ATPase [Gemmatimonadaceae bacterium]|nr:AAA family ATPase [Gemmatimonadaceae bacterium]
MRLIRLEMQGFKSFADPTAMQFDPGVSAIVGPNGCGKSNVSDAVRWVLGEQRARILRGAKMEEVIFQGSSARRAVNVAEVSLVFENDGGVLPTPFREVSVTRRLSRSGESEYLLNGATCRLRDIHDLLRGTGLGADSGVVIEQRMIDALLSDRPDDRRELFEEAAGVGLYRDRRRSTERRLEETTQDLARLDDLLGEVQSQVRSLARQRKRAERHSELTARRFSIELTLASRDMESWREELRALEGDLHALRASAPELERAVHAAEQVRDGRHGERTAADAHRNELARQVVHLRDHVQQLRSEIAVSEERHRNAIDRRRRAEAEQVEGRAAGTRLDRSSADITAEREQLEQTVADANEDLTLRSAAENRSREAVHLAREALDAAERALRASQDRARDLELDREVAARELHELQSRTRSLDGERGQLIDATDALAREVEEARRVAEAEQAVTAQAAAALEAARLEARLARDHDVAMREDVGRAEDLFTALEGRVSGLEALERERAGLAPAAAALLRARERFGTDGILGPLSDFVTASAQSAAVVERFLGATIHAVLVRDRAAADAIREWHAHENPGALLLLPLDAALPRPGSDHGDLLAQLDVAPQAQAWVSVLLERVRALADGAFIDPRGAVWLPGAATGQGPLRRRAELTALRAELAQAAEARQAAQQAAEAAREALRVAERRAADATDAAMSAQEQERRAAESLAELDRRKVRYDRDLAESREVAGRLSARAEHLERYLRDVDRRMDEVRGTVDGQERDIEALRFALVSAERALDTAREARADGQVNLAQANARLQVMRDRAHRLEEERTAALGRLATLEQELAALDEADRVLAERMAAWHSELSVRVATLSDAEGRLAAAEAAVVAADEAVATAEHALDAARREAHERAEALHHAELRFTELSGRRAAIRERLEAEWRRPLDELLTSFEPVALDDDALRAEAETLRQQLEALGPVNPLAIEEHEEEVKRFEFLTTQRNDLNDAKNSLQLAIREIDTTARELFLGTFTQVRENFRRIFMTLFGGGECDLRLENPDAPLDCDIEIHASPRGKRTQRIHLLSSGERALVALSLLFGIFLTKPSPFCLLDEVDAPLDDANIGRFVRMLNEFKQKTQFIVITHNPRTTTEAADAVYGITMQEPGVSSVVSVRMRGTPLTDIVTDDVADEPVERTVEVRPVSEAVPAPL